MIRVSQIKVSINDLYEKTEGEQFAIIRKSLLRALKLNVDQLKDMKIVKKSIDARKKNDINYIFTVEAMIENEIKWVKQCKSPNVSIEQKSSYEFQPSGQGVLNHRPVIVGTGPAGLFCALMLAERGYCPLVLERGAKVELRTKQVNDFWIGTPLNPNSNVQFGEGGAGTFSDGKLNTMVKDSSGRNTKVLETFVEYGAPSEIQYLNKPHIGTDQLVSIVKNMRERITQLGGEVRFETQFTDFTTENGTLTKIQIDNKEWIDCEVLVLATGHSARDTFSLLHERGLTMLQKSFAIGLRIEHPQELISRAQYGEHFYKLPAADYKLTYQATTGRSMYSFCMCPGGFVVNSSSEEGHLVVNGMSNYKRNEKNANSAMIVSVTPEDFQSQSPLAGIEFQRKWERMAYQTGEGKIPVQLLGDFSNKRCSSSFGTLIPNTKGDTKLANLRECIPDYVADTIVEGLTDFNRKIPGFSNEEAVLSGVETRTSSPVRVVRDEKFESNYKGIYPCGEGAGYAGGITSASMDGIKVYEAIVQKYKPIR